MIVVEDGENILRIKMKCDGLVVGKEELEGGGIEESGSGDSYVSVVWRG